MVHGHEVLTKIDLKLKVWVEKADEKKLRSCFDAAKEQCSLTKAVSIPIEFSLKIKEKKS